MSYTANLGNDKTRHVGIPAGNVQLDGELQIPVGASGVVLFAHGSGSSRHSTRNQFVAQTFVKPESARCHRPKHSIRIL